jgi:hypothetical protein
MISTGVRPYVDISGDGGVMKRVLRFGDASAPTAVQSDTVHVAYKLFLRDGELIHDSTQLDDHFTFVVVRTVLRVGLP